MVINHQIQYSLKRFEIPSVLLLMDTSNSTGFRLEVFLNAFSLGDLDFFSKSDPFVKLYFGKTNNKWNYIGRTETIANNLNPSWTKTFVLDYVFEARQEIMFEVCDDDGANSSELIGSVETTLGAMAGAKFQTSFLNLFKQGKAMGRLITRCQKVEQCNQFAVMKWQGVKLMNTDSVFDWWNKSDPYLKFLKYREDNTLVMAAQTEVVPNTLEPSWIHIEIPTFKLAKTKNDKFKIECWDREPEGKKHQFIGELSLSAAELQTGKSYKLYNPKNNNPGTLVLDQFSIVSRPPPPTFVDYLRSGLELNLIVAIDFTGSNGSPNAATSLHYINPTGLNNYQSALRAIGDILLNYDSDKNIPCFGFGAKPKFPDWKQTVANHCFPLSGNFNDVNATSMTHLQKLYTFCVSNVQFAGPTYFHPLMVEAFKVAQQSKQSGSNTYQVLLILTDGEIHDMDKTIDLIFQNTSLPISIIIVGVGNADFQNMKKLDGDNGLYNSHGTRAARDIVQFVPFREMNNNPVQLSSSLLAELPNQVVQYMNLIGRKPGPNLNVDLKRLMQAAGEKGKNEAIGDLLTKAEFLNQYVEKGTGKGMVQKIAQGAKESTEKNDPNFMELLLAEKANQQIKK